MEMHVYKGRSGYTCESKIPLDNGKTLELLTMKRYNGQLVTTAQVGVAMDNFGFSYIPYQDFSKVLIRVKPKRLTENFAVAQHNSIEPMLIELKKEIEEFYANTKTDY